MDEAHAALDQSRRASKTIIRKGTFARLGPIHFERFLGFLGKVHQLGRAGLHAVSHLEGVDARGNFRVAHDIEAFLVQGLEGVEGTPLHLRRDAGRIGQEQNRIAAAAEWDALINGGQEACAPVARAAAGAAGGTEHDKAGRDSADSLPKP